MITSDRLVELVLEADSIVHRGANPESRSDYAAAVFSVLVDQERESTPTEMHTNIVDIDNAAHRPGRAL